MLRTALVSLWHRRGAAVGGLLTLVVAAAVVSACGALLATGLRGPVAPGRFAGTPVVVTADQQLHRTETEHKHGKTKQKVDSEDLAERALVPASVGARLERLGGATVVADRTFAVVVSRPGHGAIAAAASTVGHTWAAARLTPYAVTAGRAPAAVGEVVLDAGLAARAGLEVGDRVDVQTAQSVVAETVVGTAHPSAPDVGESAVFLSESEAAAVAGHGDAVTAYGVFGASAAEVRTALDGTGAVVATGDQRGLAALPTAATAKARLMSMSAAIGGTAVIVAVLVVVGTFTLSIQQRHRELALLRAIGATPRQVRRTVRVEAVVLGVVGGVAGAAVGRPVAALIREEFVARGVVPAALRLAPGPLPAVAGVVVTLLAALVGSRVAARRISRIRPVAALTESELEPAPGVRARTVVGVVVAVAAALVTLLLTVLHSEPASLPVTYLGVVLWTTALALLGPVLVRAGVTVLTPGWRAARVGGFLAAANARTASRRTASVVTPLVLLLALASTILFVPTTVSAAVRAETRDGWRADRVVESAGPGVPAAVTARIRATPGVVAAVSVVGSSLWVGPDRCTVHGLGGPGLTAAVDPGVTAGSLADLGVGTVALSARAAQGHRLGDALDVTLGDGTTTSLTLVAIYRRGLGFGDALMSFDQLVAHVDTPAAQRVLVTGPVTAAALRSALTGFDTLRLVDAAGYSRELTARHDANDAAASVLLALVVVFCGIAVVTTTAVATVARVREFAVLRLTGATSRQVRSMLRFELALVVTLAAVLATLAAGATLAGFSLGLVGSVVPTVEPLTYAGLLLGAGLLAGAALLLPARALLRRPVVREIGTAG